jgi:hypothetical protein
MKKIQNGRRERNESGKSDYGTKIVHVPVMTTNASHGKAAGRSVQRPRNQRQNQKRNLDYVRRSHGSYDKAHDWLNSKVHHGDASASFGLSEVPNDCLPDLRAAALQRLIERSG